MMKKNPPLSRLGIAVKSGEETVNQTLADIRKVLSCCDVATSFIGRPPAGLAIADLPSITEETIGETCDLVLVVGGDGSFLKFAKTAAHHGVPMLGINRGRVGFLTELAHSDIARLLPKILRGDYLTSQAMLLKGLLKRENETLCVHKGFNDMVVHSRSGRMLELDLTIDDMFVYSERSDGLIVATPVGSTAYALSAGGPIITPGVQAIGLINISPHTLSHRPLILSPTSHIAIKVKNGKSMAFYADGWGEQQVLPGDTIEVCVADEKVPLIHPLNYNFYTACRLKLDWHHRRDNQTSD